jgi:large subunit ribosomal protein L23
MSALQHNIVLGVVISEKSTIGVEQRNEIVLKVRQEATKKQIKNEVERFVGLKPMNIRVCNVLGKIKRHGKTAGRQKSWKKAYVSFSKDADLTKFTATE